MERTRMQIITLAALSLALAAALAACGGGAPKDGTVPDAGTSVPADTTGTQPGVSSPVADATTPAASAESGAQPAESTAPGVSSPTAPEAAAPTPAAPVASAEAAAAARRQIGEITMVEGKVTVHRAGGYPGPADIGDTIMAYDVLVTGPDGRAEVDLGSGTAGGAIVKLTKNTAFYFDTSALDDGSRRTVLQLLTGALAIKVDKLAGGSFSLAADTTVLGVRGTTFIVDTIPDGSILVTTTEGSVEVTDDSGGKETSSMGNAVILPVDGSIATVGVPADASTFRKKWTEDAFAAFAAKALFYTSNYVAALEAERSAFDAAVMRLSSQEATFRTWRQARADGTVPRFTEYTEEKKAVAAVLFDCLKGLFTMERAFFRLQELKAYHDAGTGVGKLKDGRSSAEYFKAFDTATADLAGNLAYVREALGLFAWVSAGSPLGSFFGAKAGSLGTGSLFLGEEDW